MSKTHLSLVNQKLAHASSILTIIEQRPASSRHEHQALLEAMICQLHMAFHFYLRELAQNHGIKTVASIYSIPDFQSALQNNDKTSSESSELFYLAAQRGTWLTELMRSYDGLFASRELPKEKKAFKKEGQSELIELVNLIESEPELPENPTVQLLNKWLTEFRALITRHRETSAEY